MGKTHSLWLTQVSFSGHLRGLELTSPVMGLCLTLTALVQVGLNQSASGQLHSRHMLSLTREKKSLSCGHIPQIK